MLKFWWKGEPIIVGSFRWRIIINDLENEIKDVMKRFKPHSTIDEAVSIAHKAGLTIRFSLLPKHTMKGEA